MDSMVEKREHFLLRTSIFSIKYVAMSSSDNLNYGGIVEVAERGKGIKLLFQSANKQTTEKGAIG